MEQEVRAEKRGLAREIDMTKGRILPQILMFALPIMATGILQLLFNLADLVVIGKYKDTNSMGAIGATGSIVNLIVNFFMGLATGAGVLMANHFGAKDKESASRLLHTAMPLSIISGIAISVIGCIFCEKLLILMNTTQDKLPLSTLYLMIYFCGAPFNMVYNFGAAILRATGDIVRPLLFLTLGGVLNVIINLISVICLHMGVEGVALATIASQGVSAVLVVIALVRNKGFVKLEFKKMHIHKKPLINILKIGLPSGLQSALFSVSNIIIQSSINSFGDNCIEGNSAAGSIDNFIYTIINSISHACVTAVGQNYGVKDYKRIKKFTFHCALTAMIVGIISGVIFYLCRDWLIWLFASDEIKADADKYSEFLKFANQRLTIMLLSYFTISVMDVVSNGLRGMGFSITPMALVLIGTCLLRIVWIYTIVPLYNTYSMVMISYPVSWVITSIASVITFVILFKRRKKQNECNASEVEENIVKVQPNAM